VFDAALSDVEGGIQYRARVISLWTPARSRNPPPDEFETDLRLVCDLVELDGAEPISLREAMGYGASP